MLEHEAGPIVVLTDFFAPAVKAGGPVQSLAALTGSEIGVRVWVLAGDRDLGDTGPMPGLQRGCWTPHGRGQVMFFDARSPLTLWRGWRVLRRLHPSHVYVNSLFALGTGLIPVLLARLGLLGSARLVLAPRGQLDPGALSIGAAKKQFVLRVLRSLRLLDGVRWHATSALEEQHIRAVVGAQADICTSLPVPASAGTVDRRSRPSAPLRLLFLARISPKKGLAVLLQALGLLSTPVTLDVFGPRDDVAYAERCEALARQLAPLHRVDFHGAVAHDEVGALMQRADAFVLPTQGENFGHAIFEALSAGCPVVLTPTTPWTAAVGGGAGWLVEPGDVAGLAAVLAVVSATTVEQFLKISEAGSAASAAYLSGAEEQPGWVQLFT